MKSHFASRLQALLLAVLLLFGIAPHALASTNSADAVVLSTESEEIDIQRYYYNQLNDLEKRVYNTFASHKDDIFSNKSFSFFLGPLSEKETYVYSVARARQAFIMDDPQVLIWFQNVHLSLDFQRNSVYVHVEPKDTPGRYSDLSSEEMTDAFKKLEQKASTLASSLIGTDSQKLLQIYNWLISHADYDYTYELPNARNIYGALINGEAICSGFAYAYQYIASLAGLEVLYVTGMYSPDNAEPGYHAWNMAKVDGKWYFIDATAGATVLRIYKGNYFLLSTTAPTYSLDTQYFTYPS